jgi:CRP-like cAMP-binding protein
MLPLFADCSVRELTRIHALLDEVEAPSGRVLMAEGKPGRETFIVLEGEARVTLGGHHLADLGPGSVFGEMSLIENQPRSATVTAATPMRLFALGQRQFWALLDHRSVSARLLKTMSGRLRETQESLADTSS